MHSLAIQDVNLSNILKTMMGEKKVNAHTVAGMCEITYQTVKNVLDGKSPNARFVKLVVAHFGLNNDPDFLRRILVAYLLLQFPEDDGELLKKAGILDG